MRISVVIPAYNVAAFIAETLQSVLRQTRPVHEVLVIDDGSKDDTAAIAESFGGIVQVVKQKNAGASTARNNALGRATGELIAFLDADDVWAPTKIEKQVAYLEAHPEVGTVAASFVVFGAVAKDYDVHMNDAQLRSFGPVDFLSSPRVHPSTLVFRRAVSTSFKFPDGIGDVEDVIYAALLRTQAPIGAIEEILMRRREHAGQITRTSGHFGRGLGARIKWGRANAQLLGLNSPDVVDKELFRVACDDVMARYWTRDLNNFRSMRQQLLDMWPREEAPPAQLQRAIPPAFLLKLRDLFGSGRGA